MTNDKESPDVEKNSIAKQALEGKMNFNYIKSNAFRVIHIDGAHGCLSPHGDCIQMALFNERFPIPKQETYELKDNTIGKRVDKDERKGIVREVEVEVMMPLASAISVYNWLGQKIEDAQKAHKGK